MRRLELQAALFATTAVVAIVVAGYIGLRLVPAWLLDLDTPLAPLLMVIGLIAAAGLLICATVVCVRQFLCMLRRGENSDG